MHSLKLIAGLGNPGRKHERDRHNVGFWFVSRLAAAQRIELKSVAKYHAMLGKLALASGDLWLLLPQTYMNLSGKSVGTLARYYKIQPQEILMTLECKIVGPREVSSSTLFKELTEAWIGVECYPFGTNDRKSGSVGV